METLDSLLYNMSNYSNNVFVFSDSNINLLQLNENAFIAQYLETIYSNGFNQIIGKATRITQNSFTLIDHILTKSNCKFISGTLTTDFSDHFTNFIVLNTCINHAESSFRYIRNFSKENIGRFNLALNNINWRHILEIHDVNESFNEFWQSFKDLFNLYFPLKKS
jgi:hypothetical protein